METIDILVPVYNCDKYIEKCLDSIFAQTYKNLRVVIADDGSTDKSAILIEKYRKNHKNLEVYTKTNENSIPKTRNFLLTKIKSNLFTFVDSDDYLEPDYIETLYNLMTSYNADMSLVGKVRHKENKKFSSKKLRGNEKILLMEGGKDSEAIQEMLSSNLYNGTLYCKLFKTTLAKGITFDENIHYGEDLDYCYQVMKNCNSFAMSTNKLYHYIVRTGSFVTSKFSLKKLTCLDCYDKIIEDVKSSEPLSLCAISMQGLIAIELLYYTWRDHYKDKALKKRLKLMIKNSMPYVRKNKKLSKITRKAPLVWWLTKIM